MRNSIGNGRGIGGCLRHALQGEDFIRHCGNDKLIFDFKSGSGTVVKDRSREGNDGTFGAGAAAPTWKRNSLYFDGGDYVTGGDLGMPHLSGKMTLMVLFNAGPDSSGDCVFRYGVGKNVLLEIMVSSATSCWVAVRNFAETRFLIVWAGNIGNKYISLTQITDIDNSEVTGYKDAVYKEKKAFTGTYNNPTGYSLGAYANTYWNFYGFIKKIVLCDGILSQIEIQQEYLANKFSNN